MECNLPFKRHAADDSILRLILRDNFECSQTVFFTYWCTRNSLLEKLVASVDGKTQGNTNKVDFYQNLEETKRLAKSATGYNLRVQANAVIFRLSLSGFLVIIAMFYTATIMNKQILSYFVGDNELIHQQSVCELDITKHVKDD